MFDGGVSRSQMKSSVYPIFMNCRYTHSLDDIELLGVIESLQARELIQVTGNSNRGNSNEDKDPVFTLTESGGVQWELERKPNWNRFIVSGQKLLGVFPTGSIRILCTEERLGRQYLGALFASGMITPSSSIKTRAMYNLRLVPWKSFPFAVALRCRTSDSVHHLPKTDFTDAYEAVRSWWVSLDELRHLDEPKPHPPQ